MSPSLVDLDGCEDPTVHIDGAMLRVWFTGYNEQQKTGRLLLARGPSIDELAKGGAGDGFDSCLRKSKGGDWTGI